MANESVAIIVNPVSGGGKALRSLPAITSVLGEIGCSYDLYVTKGPGDATPAATRFADAGARVVIAAGGDGTINEVANGLYRASQRAALGVLPVGSGSDFARTINAPKKVDAALRRAIEGPSRPIDLGLALLDDGNERVFINVAGLGFDAMVAERVEHSRLPGSNLPYLVSALQTLATFHNIPVTVEIDGHQIATPAVFAQVANACYMGGGFKIAPMARIDDGKLDLALVGDLGKKDLLRNLPGVYGGKHVSHPKFTHRTLTSVRISATPPVNIQLDGELFGATPVTFSVLPGAIDLAG